MWLRKISRRRIRWATSWFAEWLKGRAAIIINGESEKRDIKPDRCTTDRTSVRDPGNSNSPFFVTPFHSEVRQNCRDLWVKNGKEVVKKTRKNREKSGGDGSSWLICFWQESEKLWVRSLSDFFQSCSSLLSCFLKNWKETKRNSQVEKNVVERKNLSRKKEGRQKKTKGEGNNPKPYLMLLPILCLCRSCWCAPFCYATTTTSLIKVNA